MNLHRLPLERAEERRPVRVGLIGAGTFGAMLLAQARRTPGLHVVAIADLSLQRARDALARLIFLASLSRAVNPLLGLSRSELVRALTAPGRDLAGLNAALDRLQAEAWYLHPTRDGKLLFRDVENLVAKLDSYTQSFLEVQREAELRARLEEMFAPAVRSCYQMLKTLPPLDVVQLTQDQVALVLFKPGSDRAEILSRVVDWGMIRQPSEPPWWRCRARF